MWQSGESRVTLDCVVFAGAYVDKSLYARPDTSNATGLSLHDSLRACNVVSRDWDLVRLGLARHPDLADLLPGMCDRVRREFGPDAELALELYRDPEIPDEYLTLYVRPAGAVGNLIERLEMIADSFAEDLERSSGYLLLTSDFRMPGSTNGV